MADAGWIASAAPIVHLGARPVFVDILADSWCLDPDLVEQAITPRTKAILAVHLYGNLCEMDQLLAIGRRHGIPVIEDAAEAIGSIYRGRRAGSMGAFGAFSFHGTKTMTTGEGGMFVTDDPELYEVALTLSNHGRARSQSRQFWPDRLGFKYKMSNIQAAIGCAQLERLESLVERKRQILATYKDRLEILGTVRLNHEPPHIVHGAWMPVAVFDRETGVSRERLLAAFEDENIDARCFFWPLSELPIFSPRHENINARDISSRAINLPSYHDITEAAITHVSDKLQEILDDCVHG